MHRFWYALFYILAIIGLTNVIAAWGPLLAHPGTGSVAKMLGWGAFLLGSGFMLFFQDYRQMKARGHVKTPVPAFEKMLRPRNGGTDGKDAGL